MSNSSKPVPIASKSGRGRRDPRTLTSASARQEASQKDPETASSSPTAGNELASGRSKLPKDDLRDPVPDTYKNIQPAPPPVAKKGTRFNPLLRPIPPLPPEEKRIFESDPAEHSSGSEMFAFDDDTSNAMPQQRGANEEQAQRASPSQAEGHGVNGGHGGGSSRDSHTSPPEGSSFRKGG